jgi:hypothetical protein
MVVRLATNTVLAGGGQDYGLTHREYAPSKIAGAFVLRPPVHDQFTLFVPCFLTTTFNGIGILHDHPNKIGALVPQGIITFWVARSRKAAQACSNRMVSCWRISSNSRLISA